MMLNDVALRELARLEHPMPRSMTELEYRRYIEQLVTPKFEYVVTPQTYGKNRVSKDLRLKWLAQSMDIMMSKYPRLKARRGWGCVPGGAGAGRWATVQRSCRSGWLARRGGGRRAGFERACCGWQWAVWGCWIIC